MQDYFHIRTLNAPAALEVELIALKLYDYNLRYPNVPNPLISNILELDVMLNDPRLPAVKDLAVRFNLLSTYVTKFSEEDYSLATWFEVSPLSWLGYPKPESDWENATYDLEYPDYCTTCGRGSHQIAPFRFSSSHRGGKTISFFHPGWVYDELFVRVAVWRVLEECGITGIESFPVLQAGSKKPFDDIVQIKIAKMLGTALTNADDFAPTICTDCGLSKLAPFPRVKKLSAQAFHNQPDFVKSFEWFGSGREARRLILVSRRFAELVWKKKWKGIKLQPVSLRE